MREVPCDRCDGCGWYEGGPTLKTACEQCGGTGVRVAPPSRADWTVNDDGVSVPRRTFGSIAHGYSQKDFTLVCQHCGDDYGPEPDLPLGVVHEHFKRHHPEHLGPDGNAIQLELLWLGRGPAPKGKRA